MAQPQDGGLIKTYAVLSWIILRLYAAAFLGLTWVAVQWLNAENPSLAELTLGYNPIHMLALTTAVGLSLLFPPITPGFMHTPRSIFAGAAKAVAIAGLSYFLFLTVPTVLTSGMVPNGNEFVPLVPTLLKAVAGTAITGAILVSFFQQLNRGRTKAKAVAARNAIPKELRSLRHMRMGQP